MRIEDIGGVQPIPSPREPGVIHDKCMVMAIRPRDGGVVPFQIKTYVADFPRLTAQNALKAARERIEAECASVTEDQVEAALGSIKSPLDKGRAVVIDDLIVFRGANPCETGIAVTFNAANNLYGLAFIDGWQNYYRVIVPAKGEQMDNLTRIRDKAIDVLGSEEAADDWLDKMSATLGDTPRNAAATQEGALKVMFHLGAISRHSLT